MWGKNKNPTQELEVMSTSVLYHTFGVQGIQHISTVFLQEGQFFTAGFILTD